MKSNTEWAHWGKTDPLFGVASVPGRERGGENPWTEESFYSEGEQSWQVLYDLWRVLGIKPGTALEIGCGAGRLTAPAARVFRTVIGVDVSPGMLDFARNHVGASNISWQLTDGSSLPIRSGSVSSVYSTLVFQHFETSSDGLALFHEIYRILESGGSFLIDLPMYAKPQIAGQLARPMLLTIDIAMSVRAFAHDLVTTIRRSQLRAGHDVNIVRATVYEIRELVEALRAIGFQRITIPLSPTDSGPRFLFAQKDS